MNDAYPLPDGVMWYKLTIIGTTDITCRPFHWDYGWVQDVGEDGKYGIDWAPYEENYRGSVDLGVRFDTAQEAQRYLWLKFIYEGVIK